VITHCTGLERNSSTRDYPAVLSFFGVCHGMQESARPPDPEKGHRCSSTKGGKTAVILMKRTRFSQLERTSRHTLASTRIWLIWSPFSYRRPKNVIASAAKQSLLSCMAVPNPRLPRRFAPRNDKPAPRITRGLPLRPSNPGLSLRAERSNLALGLLSLVTRYFTSHNNKSTPRITEELLGMHPHEFGVQDIVFWVECARDQA
jgi:hypothetical protein